VEGSRAQPARLVIADDHPLLRGGMRALLEGEPDLEIVGEAQDGQEALEVCRRLRPDLVLMDIRMPKMDGVMATREIKRELPRTVVLIVTSHENPDYLLEALKAGAGGYVLKEASRQQMTEEIRRALDGETPINQELAKQLLMRLADENKEGKVAELPHAARRLEGRTEPPAVVEALSPRELEVLRLMVRGQHNREIAQNLLIGVSTVKKHVRQILAKLGVSDRTQAAVRAIELGLLPDAEED
jgi:DNA-binding NarL/FixJ family response regulator